MALTLPVYLSYSKYFLQSIFLCKYLTKKNIYICFKKNSVIIIHYKLKHMNRFKIHINIYKIHFFYSCNKKCTIRWGIHVPCHTGIGVGSYRNKRFFPRVYLSVGQWVEWAAEEAVPLQHRGAQVQATGDRDQQGRSSGSQVQTRPTQLGSLINTKTKKKAQNPILFHLF